MVVREDRIQESESILKKAHQGELYYPEIMAPGVALLDYDNDSDLDSGRRPWRI
jgi:hypothetical protein